MGIKAMLEEEADELARGLNENEQAKDLTAPLVSAEPEIASMVRLLYCCKTFVFAYIAILSYTQFTLLYCRY
jgi:hypothetical protein